jgi:hypothetical protein
MERSDRQPGEPQSLAKRGDQRLVIDGLAGIGKNFEEGEDPQELFVSGKVARHDAWYSKY